MKRTKNRLGKILLTTGLVIMVVSGVLFIMLSCFAMSFSVSDAEDFKIVAPIAFLGAISGLIVLTCGEMIILLQEIADAVKNKNLNQPDDGE